MAETAKQKLDLQKLQDLGERLRSTFTQYQSDRLVKEEAWLSHLRQYKGIYGEDVVIPANRSKAYPRMTRAKCVTAKARLMNMLFPAGEKNWGIQPLPAPQLDPAALQGILMHLQSTGEPINLESIQRAVHRFAQVRAEHMEKVVDSQFRESGYEEVVRKVVGSAILYGTGVMKGPLAKSSTASQITQNPETGQWEVAPSAMFKPILEFVQIWDFFPDLSANDWESCDGAYFRHVMSRHEFRQLGKRPDFLKKNIDKWLEDNAKGNYNPAFYRAYMKALGYSTIPSGSQDKIELMEYWGYVSGHALRDVGLLTDKDTAADVAVNIWMVDNIIVKAVLNPFDADFKPYHVFVYEQDDTSLLGSGIPAIIEDSQRALCAATRMMLDNASVTTGPIFEINVDLLTPDGSADPLAILPFKVFPRESGPDSTVPAVRQVPVVNHVPDLLSIINQMREFATEESAISSSAVGDSEPSQESLRTSSGISMIMGASMIQIRDTIKNFDRFTRSVVRGFIHWNNAFSMDASIKGDHDPVARGSTSLVAREVRMTALDQLAAQLNPADAVFIDRKALLLERFKLHDLPIDQIMKSDEEIAKDKQQADAQTQEQQQLMADKIRSEIQMALATAFMNIAKGDAAANSAQAEFYASVMNTLGVQNESNPKPVDPSAPQGAGIPGPAAPGGPVIPSIPGAGGIAPGAGSGPVAQYPGLGGGGAMPPQSTGLPGVFAPPPA